MTALHDRVCAESGRSTCSLFKHSGYRASFPSTSDARYTSSVGGIWRHRIPASSNEPRFELGPETLLVPLDMDDAPLLVALVEHSRAYLARWLPWLERVRDLEAVRDLIRISKREQALGRALRFGIWHRDHLAGVVTLEQIHRQRRYGSVGYWLDQRDQGQGLATASVAALCRYGIQTLGLGRIELSAAAENERSRRVAERLGFRFEGILRCREFLHGEFVDHAVYSLTVRDPLPPLVRLTPGKG